MATDSSSTSAQIDKIWKALRLVPDFDGNSHVLVRFLYICDNLVSEYAVNDNETEGKYLINSALLNGILNKITGAASRTLATNGIPSDWEAIRKTLINSFSDHRDECSLYTDLSMLTQGFDTPQVFFEKVQTTLSTIMTYVQLHDKEPSTIEAKRALYNKLALQSFTRGLNEPIGSRVRCMRPETLEKALEYTQDEINVVYLQNKNHQSSQVPKRNFQPSPHMQGARNFSLPQNNNFGYSPQPKFTPYQNTSQMQSKTPFTPGNAPPFRHQFPSRTQQEMRALPRSNMSTGFKIPPRPQYSPPQRPVPMSGISHPVARQFPLTRQYDQRQANVNETYEQYYDDHYTEDYYQFCESNPDNQPNDYLPIEYETNENSSQSDETNFPPHLATTPPE